VGGENRKKKKVSNRGKEKAAAFESSLLSKRKGLGRGGEVDVAKKKKTP